MVRTPRGVGLGSVGAGVTGTERAALRLALGVLRSGHHGQAFDRARNALAVSGATAGLALQVRDAFISEPFPEVRILRARLALYIRAVLRAEAGWEQMEHSGRCEDWSKTGAWRCYQRVACDWPVVCSGCGEPLGFFSGYEAGEAIAKPCPVTQEAAVARYPHPLWLDAPEHR